MYFSARTRCPTALKEYYCQRTKKGDIIHPQYISRVHFNSHTFLGCKILLDINLIFSFFKKYKIRDTNCNIRH